MEEKGLEQVPAASGAPGADADPKGAGDGALPRAEQVAEAQAARAEVGPPAPPIAPSPEPQIQGDDAQDDDGDEKGDEDDGPEENSPDTAQPQVSAPGAAPEPGAVVTPGTGEPGQSAQPSQQAAPGQPGESRGRRRRRRRRGRGGQGQPGQQGQQGQPQGQSPNNQGQPPREGEKRQDGRGERTQEPKRHEERGEKKHEGRGDRGERRHEERGEKKHEGRGDRGERRHEGRGEHHRGEHHRGDRVQEQRPTDQRPKKPVKREILANTSFEETRVAIVEDGRLSELLWERKSEESIVGNIYKGTVENVLPGISSAFVNIGFEKNAYLYISDVLGERGAAIDATLKKGQEIMIQVAKEAISTKGMKVTMDVALPGRYLVFTPFQETVGLSKHIEDPVERQRLSTIVDKLVAEVLGGRGVVVRTEAEGASEQDLKREVQYLLQTWQGIQKKFESQPSPALLHKDLDLTLQVVRDILSEEAYVYLVDSKDAHKKILDLVADISPELKDKVKLYDGKTPIFKAFDLEKEIENIRKTKVTLPNGGSIIIQEAESLCAVDVNTGRFTGSKSQEETVTHTNIEAAAEIAHQLRLRNIGGIIVVDFIDMKKASSRAKVMEAFASACRADRAKIRILPITRLGLIELTRERKRESTTSLLSDECPQCKGSGNVLSAETMRIRIQREIFEMTGGRPGGQVRVMLHPAVAEHFRQRLPLVEKNVQRGVKIQSDPQMHWEDYRIILE